MTHSEPPEDFEGDRDEEMKKYQARDPWEPRLKPISEDIGKFFTLLA